ncbi:MAG: hypothetical protein ACRYF0_07330 [Janthinobacterium lividum]
MPALPLPQRIIALEEHVSYSDMANRIPLAARQLARARRPTLASSRI